MRIRCIKPDILSNGDLAELGPYAFILFAGLWMVADREGRLEYNLPRIKALIFPLWDAVDRAEIGRLMTGLAERGMLQIYPTAGEFSTSPQTVQITNWKKHQRPDPREKKSELPAPPARVSVNGFPFNDLEADTGIPCNSSVQTGGNGNGNGITGTVSGGAVEDRGCGGKEPAEAENPPPPEPPKEKTPKPKPPQREHRGPQRKPVARAASMPRAVEKPVGRSGPHPPEDVALVRDSLRELAALVGMPPPDDGIVRQVLDSARGAPGEEIHGVLVALFKRHKFRAMYSWGFVPMVLADRFKVA